VTLDPTLRRPGPGRRSRPLLRTILGDALRRARLEQRRTLADVARAAKVSLPYLSEVERGRKEASSEVLAAICESLRIDLSDVLAEVGRTLAGARTWRDRTARLDAIGDRAARLRSIPGDPEPAESTGDNVAGPAVPEARSDRVAPLAGGSSHLAWPQRPAPAGARCLLAA
jgi:transcriptional regulator with XRE-family HTH domain